MQQEQIINVLKKRKAMTQSDIAREIYKDNKHYRNIGAALKTLCKKGYVIREEVTPIVYSLVFGEETEELFIERRKKKMRGNEGLLEITNEMVKNVELSQNYINEEEIIKRCLKKYPKNDNLEIIAMKIGLIEVTSSTNLFRHKNNIDVKELAEKIISIDNIDERIVKGDPEVVAEIAKANGRINLFSFATKYCCYHNYYAYGKDDYAIYDNVVKNSLPLYFDDITKNQINKWRKDYNYKNYNDYISKKLKEKNITAGKKAFDRYVWFTNRNNS